MKCWINDYEGALEDLTRADRLRPDDTFTLRYVLTSVVVSLAPRCRDVCLKFNQSGSCGVGAHTS